MNRPVRALNEFWFKNELIGQPYFEWSWQFGDLGHSVAYAATALVNLTINLTVYEAGL